MKIIHLMQSRWQEYKNIYLEELKTEPIAFLNSYYKISKLPDSEWQKRIKERSKDIYFAENNGEIVGMAGITFGEAPKNNHTVSLWGVYVKPSFRGKGIAQKILRELLKDLKDKKIVKVNLGVVVTQKVARKFYKSLGFKKSGYLHKEFYVKGKYYDEILMEKLLNG